MGDEGSMRWRWASRYLDQERKALCEDGFYDEEDENADVQI